MAPCQILVTPLNIDPYQIFNGAILLRFLGGYVRATYGYLRLLYDLKNTA